MEEVTFSGILFGDKINLLIYNLNKEKAEKIFRQFYSEALRLEKIFNFFDKDSELSKLNKKRKLKISQDLLNVINKALSFSELTKGKYDITLGKRILKRKNYEEDIKLESSYRDVKIKGNEVNLVHSDILIDLGSIAKGYITDKLGKFLISKGIKEFVIDSRGDILFSGEYFHTFGVQHPRDREKNITSIKIKNQAAATSGDYNQFDKNFSKSHILNSKEIISATVIAPTLEEADVYATALFVAEEKERKNLIENNKNIKVLLIKENLKPIMYNNFEGVIYEK